MTRTPDFSDYFDPDKYVNDSLDDKYRQAAEYDELRAMRQLDAYGHLTWTIGNEDYLCCLDACLASDGIAWHWVIDCESGGWIDTVEKGVVPISDAESLKSLPWRCADTCADNDVRFNRREFKRTLKSWGKHIDSLVADAAESDAHDELRRAALNHRGEP